MGGGGATAVVATVVAIVTGRATVVVTVGVVVLEEERPFESCSDRYDKAPAASSIKAQTTPPLARTAHLLSERELRSPAVERIVIRPRLE